MKTCKHCGSTETLHNRRVCRSCQSEYMREYVAKNPERIKLLRRVYQSKLRTDPAKIVHLRTKGRNYWRALRVEVVAAYGGKCACCGETEPMFLSIDHVNNDGAAHRRSLGAKGGNGKGGSSRTLAWLMQNGFPSGFQVLCMNCNMGKFRNGGTCPHKVADI